MCERFHNKRRKILGGSNLKGKDKIVKRRFILPILLVASFLLAAGGWGYSFHLTSTRTLRQNPGAHDHIWSNPLMTGSDSELLQLMERRHSTSRGDFTGNEISEDALQLLGWVGTGKNRDGTGFVVPIARGAAPYVTLYLAQESGVRRFSWETNDFEHVSYDDIRNQIQSTMTSVGERAYAIWIYVIETDRMTMDNIYWAWHSIGAMSQHQYLMADALDIQTRFIGGFNNDATAELLGLGANSIPASLMLMAQK